MTINEKRRKYHKEDRNGRIGNENDGLEGSLEKKGELFKNNIEE